VNNRITSSWKENINFSSCGRSEIKELKGSISKSFEGKLLSSKFVWSSGIAVHKIEVRLSAELIVSELNLHFGR